MSQQDLSERMADFGRPLQVSAISKIEHGDRRVDVDDLVALALALEVTPNRLLLGACSGDEEVELVAGRTATSLGAWQWASGVRPFPLEPHPRRPAPHVEGGEPRPQSTGFVEARYEHDKTARRRFVEENRPYDVRDGLSASDLVEHEEDLMGFWDVVDELKSKGLSVRAIASFLDIVEHVRRDDDTPRTLLLRRRSEPVEKQG